MSYKMIKIAGIVLVATWIVACGDGDSAGSSKGNGSDSASYAKTDNGFQITLKGIDSNYYHVKYILQDSHGNEKLSHGMNYNGTVTTICTKTGAINVGITYTCTTRYNTSAPMGDPKDITQNITLKIGDNTLSMQELSLTNSDKKTKIQVF